MEAEQIFIANFHFVKTMVSFTLFTADHEPRVEENYVQYSVLMNIQILEADVRSPSL